MDTSPRAVRRLAVPGAVVQMSVATLLGMGLAWWMGWLSMSWLYVVEFVLGAVHTVAGSAAQIVLTQVVTRDRLVEAHAKNALAGSGAEVAGPGVAGLLIKLMGAPVALPDARHVNEHQEGHQRLDAALAFE